MLEINKIYNDDCLIKMEEIDDNSIDAIITDLPYGQTAQNKWDTVIPFEPLWKQYKRIIKDWSNYTFWEWYVYRRFDAE